MPPNQHHTEYAPPVLRAPSPASSVGTAYGPDQTSFSDAELQLSQVAYEQKLQEQLGLGDVRYEEEAANLGPLLVRPPAGSPEEKSLFDNILTTLRNEVQELEDNELFEQMLLRGSQAALEPQPSTTDINSLMRSMMVTPSDLHAVGQSRRQANWTHDADITNGPWITNGSRYDGATDVSLLNNSVKAGKRSRNGNS